MYLHLVAGILQFAIFVYLGIQTKRFLRMCLALQYNVMRMNEMRLFAGRLSPMPNAS